MLTVFVYQCTLHYNVFSYNVFSVFLCFISFKRTRLLHCNAFCPHVAADPTRLKTGFFFTVCGYFSSAIFLYNFWNKTVQFLDPI